MRGMWVMVGIGVVLAVLATFIMSSDHPMSATDEPIAPTGPTHDPIPDSIPEQIPDPGTDQAPDTDPALTPESADTTPTPTSTEPQEPKTLTTRFLVAGMTFWGRYVDDWSNASDLGIEYPFSLLHTLKRDRYDAWIAGLECPTVPNLTLSSADQEATLTFNCPPKYLTEAARWFTAYTLANNHTDNQGTKGFATTKKQLTKHGIQYFGHYDPNQLEDLCGIVTIPATIGYDETELPSSAEEREVNASIPLVMCGYHGLFQIPSQESIDVVTRYKDVLPVIALPHMGAEYVAAADQIKTRTYHALIDAGADMVLGDHPHWIQPSEVYQGKLIVYSLGNFMFDQQSDRERTRSAAIDITARSTDPEAIAGWTALAETCRDQGPDVCVELAREQGLPRLTLDYTFRLVGTSDADRRAHKASASELAEIKDRLNWSRTMADLT